MELNLDTIKLALRQVLHEETGAGRYEIAPRWDGGTLVLKPADDALKPKDMPLNAFFKKVTAVREKLRLLEQKINSSSSLTLEERAEFQMLITRAYGSLTSFNVLFKQEEDRFHGTGGERE